MLPYNNNKRFLRDVDVIASAELWNNVPLHVKNSVTISQFKVKSLKAFLIVYYYLLVLYVFVVLYVTELWDLDVKR